MSEKLRKKFLEVFLQEWAMSGASGDPRPVEKPVSMSRDEVFDSPVNAGEIRVFATGDRPLLGLVFKKWGADDWFVVPVSDFTVPATEQEILLGDRVYQLWNAFSAPRGFVNRSWLVDTVEGRDLEDLGAAFAHMTTGEPVPEDLAACLGLEITALDDPRLDYERVNMVALDFASFLKSEAATCQDLVSRLLPQWKWREALERSECPELLRGLAAASSGGQNSVIWMLEGRENSEEAFKEVCVECRFSTPFRSIDKMRDPYVLRFSAQLPDSWKGEGRMEVFARNYATGETAGKGELDLSTGEGKITTVQTEDCIGRADGLVLVMARRGGADGDL